MGPPGQSAPVLRDVSNTLTIGYSPSAESKAASVSSSTAARTTITTSHDFAERDDAESITSSDAFPPPPSLPPIELDDVSPPSEDDANSEHDDAEIYSTINESGIDLLAIIKQRVTTARKGLATKVSRLKGGSKSPEKHGRSLKKAWRIRARETDWDSALSIRKNFRPFQGEQCGKQQPPPLMLAGYHHPYHKAHAVVRWNRMSLQTQHATSWMTNF